jgi:hypothetical protein
MSTPAYKVEQKKGRPGVKRGDGPGRDCVGVRGACRGSGGLRRRAGKAPCACGLPGRDADAALPASDGKGTGKRKKGRLSAAGARRQASAQALAWLGLAWLGLARFDLDGISNVTCIKQKSNPFERHGMSRNVKHISVIVCISTTRKSLISYISTSQDFASVREQLKKHGVRFGANLVLKSNPKPYINSEIFLITSEM